MRVFFRLSSGISFCSRKQSLKGNDRSFYEEMRITLIRINQSVKKRRALVGVLENESEVYSRFHCHCIHPVHSVNFRSPFATEEEKVKWKCKLIFFHRQKSAKEIINYHSFSFISSSAPVGINARINKLLSPFTSPLLSKFRMLNSYINFYLLNVHVRFTVFIHKFKPFLFISFFFLTILLQSKICTWLSADWGGCTTCPFYTSWCAAWREVFTTHAWRSWTNYFPSSPTVSWTSCWRKNIFPLNYVSELHKWKIIPIFSFLNFDFLISRLPFLFHLPYLDSNIHIEIWARKGNCVIVAQWKTWKISFNSASCRL